MRYRPACKPLAFADQIKSLRQKRRSGGLRRAQMALQLGILGGAASGQAIEQIARILCRSIEWLMPRAVCAVFLATSNGKLQLLAAPSMPDGTLQALDGVLIGPEAASCGAAVASASPATASDIASDRRWSKFKAGPLAAGFKAVSSYPIIDQSGKSLGSISLFFRARRGLGRLDEALLESCLGPFALAIERGEMWQHLQWTNERFNVALSNISQGVCFFDGERKLIIANRRFSEIYGLAPESIRVGMSLAEIVSIRAAVGAGPKVQPEEYLSWRSAVRNENVASDTVVELENGQVIAIRHQPMPGGGWVGTHEDITERRKAEAQIVHMARHDALTGLPNRTLFHERLDQALAFLGRSQECAVLCLDVDHFKDVNDTFGHPAGDFVLQTVAARLQACVREVDTVTRLGGDEFAILLVNTDTPAGTHDAAQRIIRALREPIRFHGNTIMSGTSVGIALAPQDGDTPSKLLKNADLALYRAKSEARGTYRFFEADMDARVQARMALAQELRQAMHDRALSIVYQPVFNIEQQMIASFEALLRWDHPTYGLISPNEFIPVAEETGLILELGAWVLRRACCEAVQWPSSVRVSVNLSAAQFKSHSLIATVQTALDKSGLAPERLELEITESVLLSKHRDTLAMLRSLRGMGVSIAMDDFGTGYSSLSYLRNFPFNKIKVDQSFIQGISEQDESVAIIRAIVSLGRSLGMATTAEGVETEQQLEQLRREGCTEVQGFLLSHPVLPTEIADLLAQREQGPYASGRPMSPA